MKSAAVGGRSGASGSRLSSDVRLVATIASRELPVNGRDRARTLADRKTMRLLDGASTPPFLAIHEALVRSPACDPADCAIYTVSGWDPQVPDVPFELDESAENLERLSRHFYEPANPSDWLRRMPNGPICQAAIVDGFRGPNLHLVGDVEALRMAVTLAWQSVDRGEASLAIVVAYDEQPGREHTTPDEADTRAAAVSFARIGPDPHDETSVAAADVLQLVSALPDGMQALEALDACLDERPAVLVPAAILQRKRSWPWSHE